MGIPNFDEGSRSTAKQTNAVIDDDFRMLESLYDLLDAAGFGVRLFTSSDEFLRASAVYEADCVISDIALPAIDGFAWQRLVRQARRTFPVILITGRHERAATNETDCSGRIPLEKPLDREMLLAAADSELGRLTGWKMSGTELSSCRVIPKQQATVAELPQNQPIPGLTSTVTVPAELLDLATVVKVSPAVLGEMVLEELIDLIMARRSSMPAPSEAS